MKNSGAYYKKGARTISVLSGIILSLFVATLFLVAPGEAANQDFKRVSISLPDIRVEKKDRIVEFKATIINGFVVSVPRIPAGWFFRVDLPYQWKTNVVAGSIVGVADIKSDETDYFKDFLILEYTGHKDEELRIDVQITVDRYSGEKKVLRFGMKELKMKRIENTGDQAKDVSVQPQRAPDRQ
jgi:hypothetical protein